MNDQAGALSGGPGLRHSSAPFFDKASEGGQLWVYRIQPSQLGDMLQRSRVRFRNQKAADQIRSKVLVKRGELNGLFRMLGRFHDLL